MTRRQALALTALPFCLTLAACASDGQFPSLAVRDSERVSGTIAAPPPAPAPAPAPATLMQVDELLASLRQAHDGFTAEVPATRRLVAAASGAGAGSDVWSTAQVAVAGLEARRSQAMIALADLDRLYVDGTLAGQDATRLAAAQAEANALVTSENATIAELLGALAG